MVHKVRCGGVCVSVSEGKGVGVVQGRGGREGWYKAKSGPRHAATSPSSMPTPSLILVLIAVLAGASADRPASALIAARGLHRPARIAVLRGGEVVEAEEDDDDDEGDEDSSPPPPPSAKGAKPALKRQNGMKDLLSGGDAKADAISSDGDAETVEEVPAGPPQKPLWHSFIPLMVVLVMRIGLAFFKAWKLKSAPAAAAGEAAAAAGEAVEGAAEAATTSVADVANEALLSVPILGPALKFVGDYWAKIGAFARSPQAAPVMMGLLILGTRLVKGMDQSREEAEAEAAAAAADAEVEEKEKEVEEAEAKVEEVEEAEEVEDEDEED